MEAVLVGKWAALLGFTEILKACPPVWMQMILTKANMLCTVDQALSIQPLKCLRWKNQPTCMSFYSHKSLDLLNMPQKDKHQSPNIKENAQSSSLKEEESCKTSGRTSGTSSPWALDSMSSKKSPCWGKCSPQAKEQPDNHDTEDHSTSSKHKDRSRSDKSSRCGTDKESSNTPCKCPLSPQPSLPLWNTYSRDLV